MDEFEQPENNSSKFADRAKNAINNIANATKKKLMSKISMAAKLKILGTLVGVILIIFLIIAMCCVIASVFSPLMDYNARENLPDSEKFYEEYYDEYGITVSPETFEAEKAFFTALDATFNDYNDSSKVGAFNTKIDKSLIIATLFYHRVSGEPVEEDCIPIENSDEECVEAAINGITKEDFDKAAKYIDSLSQYQIRRHLFTKRAWIKPLTGINFWNRITSFFTGGVVQGSRNDYYIPCEKHMDCGYQGETCDRLVVENSLLPQSIACNDGSKDNLPYNGEICDKVNHLGLLNHWETDYVYYHVKEEMDYETSADDDGNCPSGTTYCGGNCYTCRPPCSDKADIDVARKEGERLPDNVYVWNLLQNKFIEEYYAKYLPPDKPEYKEEREEKVKEIIIGIYDFWYDVYGGPMDMSNYMAGTGDYQVPEGEGVGLVENPSGKFPERIGMDGLGSLSYYNELTRFPNYGFQCTRYAYGRTLEILDSLGYSPGSLPLNIYGNAGQWYYNNYNDSATQRPYSSNINKPKPGAIMVWTGGVGGYGHVAVVESVNPDGTINYSEGNATKNNKYGFRYHQGVSPSEYQNRGNLHFQGYIYMVD